MEYSYIIRSKFDFSLDRKCSPGHINAMFDFKVFNQSFKVWLDIFLLNKFEMPLNEVWVFCLELTLALFVLSDQVSVIRAPLSCVRQALLVLRDDAPKFVRQGDWKVLFHRELFTLYWFSWVAIDVELVVVTQLVDVVEGGLKVVF